MMKSLYGGLYGGLHGKTKEEAEKYFTELKESEDERVKKELIELISCMHDADPRKKGWIAWLEKQGETFTKKDVEDAYLQGVCDAKQELEKQGEPFDDNIITRDDEILQAISIGLTDAEKDLGWSDFGGLPIEEIHAWLEKQGDDGWGEGDVVRHGGILALVTNGRNAIKSNLEQITIQYPDEWVKAHTKERKYFFDELEKQGKKPQGKTALEAAKEEKVDNANKVEPKFKVKYAGNEYNVFETKDIAGVTFYGIEDEPNHIDYVKAENCEIISVYAIKENGSPYPTKPAVFSEKKPKRMISAEAKECIYGSDNEQVSSEKIGKNDTLLDLLQKMPSCITVDGIDYHFVLKKTIAYMAFYEGEGEEGRDKIIFWMAGEPVDLLTAMLDKLKEEGLLDD